MAFLGTWLLLHFGAANVVSVPGWAHVMVDTLLAHGFGICFYYLYHESFSWLSGLLSVCT